MLLGAALLRLGYLLALWRSPLFLLNSLPGLDMATYYAQALAFAAGRLPTPPAPFFQSPLYPLLLGGLVRLVGPSIAALTAAQVVLGVGACGLLYEIGRRLAGRRVGLLAAAIYAAYPLAWYYGGLLLGENLLVVLLLALVLLGLHAFSGGGSRAWLGLGVLCGLGSLAKPNVVLVLPVLLLAARLTRVAPLPGRAPWAPSPSRAPRASSADCPARRLASGPRLTLRAAVLACLACGLVVLPASLYNSLLAGSPQFVSVQGSHLWLAGNTAYATGLYQLPCGPSLMPWSGSFWWLDGRKLLLVLANEEFGNNTYLGVFRTYLPMLDVWPLGFGALAGLGLLGLLVAVERPARWLVPLLVLATYTASIVAFAIIGRYRLPMAALLCLPAAALLARLPMLVRRRPRRLVLAGAWVLLLSLAANTDLPPDVSVPFAHANAATVFETAGDRPTAERELDQAREARQAVMARDRHACSQIPPF